MSLVSKLEEQVAEAQSRLTFDPLALRKEVATQQPAQIASETAVNDRRQFLARTLDPSETDPGVALERILAGNELQPIHYLERGVRAARSVGRIQFQDPVTGAIGSGTGFLVAPAVLITNHHVLPTAEVAKTAEVQFGYELDLAGKVLDPIRFRLAPERLFEARQDLDFAVVAVAADSRVLETFGWLPLLATAGKALEGEWLTIVQHPGGQRKQIAVRENRLLKRSPDVLWYSTDTTGGSSGSPVFNNDWFVVALHHSGVPKTVDGRWQDIDGGDWDGLDDTRIKWLANEGIRASRIAEELRRALPQHPLLRPLFDVTPEQARSLLFRPLPGESSNPLRLSQPRNHPIALPPMNRTITLKLPVDLELEIQPDGSVVPRNIGFGTQLGAPGAIESLLERSQSTRAKKKPAYDAPFDPNYSTRSGFNTTFLGDEHVVELPDLSSALQLRAQPLLKPPSGKNKYVLAYHNFSVVMHRRRRFAIYSAANVSFANRFEMSRPQDVWREDPRIPRESQVTNFYYKKTDARDNHFDRGHLTRREDLEFGETPLEALASAADTCHWTNCTPQHARFNQYNPEEEDNWQTLERHVLETSVINGNVDAQIFTGPLLEEDDPVFEEFPEIQYPVRFWKVIAGLKSDSTLFAVAFLLDQSEIIAKYGITEADVPVAPLRHYQVSVAEIERLTQLTFRCASGKLKALRECDPLQKGVPDSWRRRFRGPGGSDGNESAGGIGRGRSGALAVPSGYQLLRSVEEVYLG